MKKLLFPILLLFFSTKISAQDSLYLWPTNSGKFLSSTFGETRSAHFHAGLDIKTWGREGYKVYASKDGILSRLLITNQGYGKAIYLKHKDGSYTVYAHLQKFNPEFQSIADSVRLQDYSYTFEEFLESQNISVKQGDIIGYTGSTGIGPPHLHFEIRNKHNQPLNPLRFNFDIKDTIAPTISSVLIEPLDISTTINGSVYPQTIFPSEVRNDTTVFDTVFVTNKFGFSPYIYDEANSVTNKYLAHKVLLSIDSDTLFYEEVNSFDFLEVDNMPINRVTAANSNRRKFQRLFIDENNIYPFLVKNKGWEPLSSGTFTIDAEDYFGNRSVAIIPVVKVRKKRFLNSKKNDFQQEHWTNNWISINDSTNIDLKTFDSGILWDSTINQRILNIREDINHTISRLEPSKSYKIESPDYKLITRIKPYTFFDTLSLVQNWTLKNDSLFIEIGKPELSIKKNIYIEMQIGDTYRNLKRINLYSINNAGDTGFIESWVTGSTLIASIGSLGKFIALSDTLSPQILSPEKIILDSGSLTYRIQTKDDLSGIDYKSAVIKINNERGIAEYDYENDTFTFYLPKFNPTKQDSLYIEVSDKAGNFVSKSFLLKN